MLIPKNPNIYQVDQLQGRASPGAVSIRCPHCHQLGSFQVANEAALGFNKFGKDDKLYSLVASTRICPNGKCLGLVFVIQLGNEIIETQPPQRLDFNAEGLPQRIEITLEEAVACHAAEAYRGAAMMVRRLLEEICDENDAKGKDLHNRLKALRTKIVLPEALFDAMDELKILGNDAAHVEARAYDNIDRDEATDSIELAKEILKGLYQLKEILERLQARKKGPIEAS